MKIFLLLPLLAIFFANLIETKKAGIHVKKIKPVHVHKLKGGQIVSKIFKGNTHYKHVHHAGIHHSRPHHSKHKAHKLIQPTTPLPLYSPPFIGVDNGQIPTIEQVALIVDWLTKVTSTIDVFLRLQATYPDGSQEQKQMVKNVYPPLRVLLAANYAHEYKTAESSQDN